MGDRLLAVLVIAAVAVLIGAVMWTLLAYTRRLDGNVKPEAPKPIDEARCFHGVPLVDECLRCAARWPR